ncbi:GPR1/FUN34/yaaH family-domain-containing protein [Xylariaceae sp. FL1019]|nr:GPR1/FUN34/yaaH family-domain-containing protein [Xylariaceae sp. FL1019]
MASEKITKNDDGINSASDSREDCEKGIRKIDTGVTMPPELFEKLYLNPKGQPYRKSTPFANPTALGFMGFTVATFMFSLVLLGWGGASGFSPVVSIFFFVAPITLLFSMAVVMGFFGVFWLSFGLLQLPGGYLSSPYATVDDPTGIKSQAFNADVGLFLIVWGTGILMFSLLSLTISIALTVLFALFSTGVYLLGVSCPSFLAESLCFWKHLTWFTSDMLTAAGQPNAVPGLQKAAGVVLFIGSAIGWYMTMGILVAEMQLPFNLPVGDLSLWWRRGTPGVVNDREGKWSEWNKTCVWQCRK